MDENRRQSARYNVFLYVEQRELEQKQVRILNLSSSGFLVRGEVCAGEGGIFHATFRVRPASGELRVTTRGKVVHSRRNGADSEYGICIEGFGSPAEERAYQEYVRELAERAATSGDGSLSPDSPIQATSRSAS
jgi:hypothetical protein